jgi:hypothetical protein
LKSGEGSASGFAVRGCPDAGPTMQAAMEVPLSSCRAVLVDAQAEGPLDLREQFEVTHVDYLSLVAQ